jgi:hypothetical protein
MSRFTLHAEQAKSVQAGAREGLGAMSEPDTHLGQENKVVGVGVAVGAQWVCIGAPADVVRAQQPLDSPRFSSKPGIIITPVSRQAT